MAARLLLVDDDPSIRTLLTRILERHGFEVTSATDGVEAIETLQTDHFDGMVLDLMMPRVDGFGVIEHLRAWDRDFLRHVVVVSAYADFNRDRIDPACGVVQKPFEILELMATLSHCLET